MALLERIGTLVRANLNELADRAEDPVTMMKQLVLDMENQLMQVKTQVALSLADQHLLQRKRTENQAKAEEFTRKAELALDKGQEQLARAALARRLSHEELMPGFDQQLADQQTQVENLKSALGRLEGKLAEARAKCDMLIAQHRRARALGKATEASLDKEQLNRLEAKVQHSSALSAAHSAVSQMNTEEQLDRLVQDDKIDRLLEELKLRRNGQPRIG